MIDKKLSMLREKKIEIINNILCFNRILNELDDENCIQRS
jgi:hypothetical protein